MKSGALEKHTCVSHAEHIRIWYLLLVPLGSGCLREDAVPSCGGSCGDEDEVLCVTADTGRSGQQELKGGPRRAAHGSAQAEVLERTCSGLGEKHG